MNKLNKAALLTRDLSPTGHVVVQENSTKFVKKTTYNYHPISNFPFLGGKLLR